jgi:secreted Zn-dependent insulinase-like peptidase
VSALERELLAINQEHKKVIQDQELTYDQMQSELEI